MKINAHPTQKRYARQSWYLAFLIALLAFVCLFDSTKVSAKKQPFKVHKRWAYENEHEKVTVKKIRYSKTWCWIARIQLKDKKGYKKFGTTCANNKYKKNNFETVSHAAKRKKALLCVNGCYSAPFLHYPVARSGKVMNNGDASTPFMYNRWTGMSGRAEDLGTSGMSLRKAVKKKLVSDTFCFGSCFLGDGKVTSVSGGPRAQRTSIGTNGKKGIIYLLVTNGRYNDGKSRGLTYQECGKILKKYGCTYGVPLDGGGSSTIVWKGKVLNTPGNRWMGERKVVDMVYLKK